MCISGINKRKNDFLLPWGQKQFLFPALRLETQRGQASRLFQSLLWSPWEAKACTKEAQQTFLEGVCQIHE